jgi:hypothetical protein
VVVTWYYRSITVVLQCLIQQCYSGVAVVLQCGNSGVTVLLQWCCSVVTVVTSVNLYLRQHMLTEEHTIGRIFITQRRFVLNTRSYIGVTVRVTLVLQSCFERRNIISIEVNRNTVYIPCVPPIEPASGAANALARCRRARNFYEWLQSDSTVIE